MVTLKRKQVAEIMRNAYGTSTVRMCIIVVIIIIIARTKQFRLV